MTISAKVICDSVANESSQKTLNKERIYYCSPEEQVNPCIHGHLSGRNKNGSCKECNRINSLRWHRKNKLKNKVDRKQWDKNNPDKAMLQRARVRARNLKLDFDLELGDILIPDVCPIFGIKLFRTDKPTDSSPSLDRIDNTKGYIKGNVIVVSHKANRIKNRWSIQELRQLVNFYEKNII